MKELTVRLSDEEMRQLTGARSNALYTVVFGEATWAESVLRACMREASRESIRKHGHAALDWLEQDWYREDCVRCGLAEGIPPSDPEFDSMMERRLRGEAT